MLKCKHETINIPIFDCVIVSTIVSGLGGLPMEVLWGILLIFVGLFMTICGTVKSNFIVYRLFVYRSKLLWGDNVHRFYQVVGIMVIVFGLLVALNIF